MGYELAKSVTHNAKYSQKMRENMAKCDQTHSSWKWEKNCPKRFYWKKSLIPNIFDNRVSTLLKISKVTSLLSLPIGQTECSSTNNLIRVCSRVSWACDLLKGLVEYYLENGCWSSIVEALFPHRNTNHIIIPDHFCMILYSAYKPTPMRKWLKMSFVSFPFSVRY